MICYSIESRDQIFVKGYGFLFFVKNMSTNISRNISKNLRGKYSQKPVDHAKQSAADALKTTSKIVIQKTAGATGDLIGNKVADKITKIAGSSTQNYLETVEGETENIVFDRGIPKERYISPEKRQQIIDKLGLI